VEQRAAIHGCVDPDVHFRTEVSERFASEFSYMGTYSPDRQHKLDTLFFQAARQLPERKFLVVGSLFPDGLDWPQNVWYQPHLAPGDHPAFYSSSRTTLNITRGEMASFGHCPSGRFFEAAACGTPIVTDCWDGLETFFQPDEEILVARQTEDVLAALELSDEQLTRIARRARQRAIEEHCARRRARQLEVILESVAANDPKPLADAAEDCPIMRGEA
jgi:spore maturation protein CgeB